MKRTRRPFLASLIPLALMARPAAAADASPTLFGGYWSDFLAHWEGVFQEQSGISMAVIGVGVVALFIITRGKWHK